MNFCSHCGSKLKRRIPPGDQLPRDVCEACGTIHYQNPRLVVGCVPRLDDRILLCRRAIEPRLGFWTVPAGFMEIGETMQQAAARETREEALADVEIGTLLAIAHVTHAAQVHVFFRAQMRSPTFGPAPESSEVMLVGLAAIPWDELAFPSIEFALRCYLEDLRLGREQHYFNEVERRLPPRLR
jgi:ADP-ribose pyrophosphatase YjhB (NUDIX family)